jgi:hypothetical protein
MPGESLSVRRRFVVCAPPARAGLKAIRPHRGPRHYR